jgi:hypothetical protein
MLMSYPLCNRLTVHVLDPTSVRIINLPTRVKAPIYPLRDNYPYFLLVLIPTLPFLPAAF